nr:cytochrome oxidase subunit II, mitochondrial [Tanacetum cinerariifolium]
VEYGGVDCHGDEGGDGVVIWWCGGIGGCDDDGGPDSYELQVFGPHEFLVGVYLFDTYTIPEDDLELGQLSLLEVDNRVVVPAKSHLHIIVTFANVLHSWVVPSSASGWSSMEPRSKAVDKIEKGVRLPVEQRIRLG